MSALPASQKVGMVFALKIKRYKRRLKEENIYLVSLVSV